MGIQSHRLLTIRVEHFTGELHLGRTQGVVGWEDELRWEYATLETGAFGATGKEIHGDGQFICWIRGTFSAGTYVISASHSKKLSSVMGPAMIPSGGFRVSSGKRYLSALAHL